MGSIIADLYYGKIIPHENLSPKCPELNMINDKIREEQDYIKGLLSKNDCTRLEKLESLYMASSQMFSIEAFSTGFRLAVKLIVDVYYCSGDITEIETLLKQ